jgi:hypothetical protein
MNSSIAEVVLEADPNDYRFERFCCAICSAEHGVEFLPTSASWDRGRDGRSGVRSPKSHRNLLCATLSRDLESKVEADLLRVTSTSSPEHLVYCSSQRLSEEKVDEITKIIRRHVPSGSVTVYGSIQLGKLAEKHSEIFSKSYAAELDSIRDAFERRPDEDQSRTGLRLALITMGTGDAAELRESILRRTVLEALQEERGTPIARFAMMALFKKTTSKKASIGDIVEIRTPAGLAYVQYTHDGGTNGDLVRVLPGLYENRPSDFAQLARQKELYFIFYIMSYALRTGLAEIVSNQPVPEWAKGHPMMRHAAAFDDFGRTIRWRIISAASPLTVQELQRTPLLAHLTPEQERLSVLEIWPHAAMVRELARGWTPERATELRSKDIAEAAEKKKEQVAGDESSYEGMRHYLCFSKKPNAEKAGERLRSRGFSVEVRKGSDGENWLALATKAPPKTGEQMDELRDEMEALAAQFGGEYDGWEAAMDSLGSGNVERGQKAN